MRRRFLAPGAAAGATTLGFPMIARSQTPITLRFQSTWPLKFIYHECAVDSCKKASDLTGGRLKIEMLPGGRRRTGLAGRRCSEQGCARRRSRHSCLLVRQTCRLRSVRCGAGFRHGRQSTDGLGRVWRRQGALCRDSTGGATQHRQLSRWAGSMRADGLVQEGDQRTCRFKGA